MIGKEYLTLDAVTWRWRFTDRLEDLRIWDYHHDVNCMKLADQGKRGLGDGQQVQYVPVTVDQVAIIDQAERDRTAKAQVERRATEEAKAKSGRVHRTAVVAEAVAEAA